MLLIDTDILIDAARNDEQALVFIAQASEREIIATSTITRLELLAGCRNKTEWANAETTLNSFTHLPVTPEISETALKIFKAYRLGHGMGLADALIAATAITHSTALASKNQKHFRFVAELNLLPWPPATTTP